MSFIVVAVDFVDMTDSYTNALQDNTKLQLTFMSVPISTSNNAFPWESIPGQQLTALHNIPKSNMQKSSSIKTF